eukprot:1351650-Rhodomonas_salina.1
MPGRWRRWRQGACQGHAAASAPPSPAAPDIRAASQHAHACTHNNARTHNNAHNLQPCCCRAH